MKTNYQFERRQRDLAKKKKQEEKRQRKLAARNPADGSPDAPPEQPGTPSPEAATPPAGDK